MKFCSQCGSSVSLKIPDGDNLPRHVCVSCETIHYQNPKIVAGCLLEWHDQVLLCRRAIEPRYGYWTLPAGFMENNESVREAAAREAFEEAEAATDDLTLYGVYNLKHISQVYMLFRGRLRDGYAGIGVESLEVDLFDEQDIPWQNLAFTVVHEMLERYFEDRRHNGFRLHTADITRDDQGRVQISRY